MVKKKYNYRFVYKDKKLYSLVVIKKRNKHQVLVNNVRNFYIIGDYLVYRKYNDSKWYMREQSSKTETLLGYAQSRVAYFSYKEDRRCIISFFNQHGDFVTKCYLDTELGYSEGRHLLVCYRNDGYYDVFVIKSRVSYELRDCHLEELNPDENVVVRYNFQYIKYNKRKKCWKYVKAKESWFEKFMNWLEEALP